MVPRQKDEASSFESTILLGSRDAIGSAPSNDGNNHDAA